MPERLDHVEVATRHGRVEIHWASREAIVHVLHELELSAAALRAFEAVGANRHVQRDRNSIAPVIDAISVLAERAGGVRHLEPGVAKLQRKLIKELREAWAAEEASQRFSAD